MPPLPPLLGGTAAPSGAAAEDQAGQSAEVASDTEDDEEVQKGKDQAGFDEGEPEAAAISAEENEAEEAAKSIAAALKPMPRWAAGSARSQQSEPSAAPVPHGKVAGGALAARQQGRAAAAKGEQPAAPEGRGHNGPQPRQQTKEQKQRGKEKSGRRKRKAKPELAAEAHEAAHAEAQAEAQVAATLEVAAVPMSKVEAVLAALEANKQLQDRLRRLLASTDRAIDRNAALQQQVRCRPAHGSRCTPAAAAAQLDQAGGAVRRAARLLACPLACWHLSQELQRRACPPPWYSPGLLSPPSSAR